MWVYVLTLYLTYVRCEVVITNSDPVTLKDFSIVSTVKSSFKKLFPKTFSLTT